ncbi:MAG: signal peptidase I, partial [Oscillospiraceae bacterium]|nr:signal peptidase I [Oscillospiraceae bacterium]
TVQGKPVIFSGYCVMQIITGSMEPALHVGDCVLVQQIASDSLQKYDIIAYVSEVQDISGLTVMHRITEVLPDGSFLVMGDANPVPDPLPVRPDQIQGKFIKKLPFFTWLTSFTDLRKVLLLLVMLVTSVTAFYEMRTVAAVTKEIHFESKEERRERLIREAIDREKQKLAQNQSKEDDSS